MRQSADWKGGAGGAGGRGLQRRITGTPPVHFARTSLGDRALDFASPSRTSDSRAGGAQGQKGKNLTGYLPGARRVSRAVSSWRAVTRGRSRAAPPPGLKRGFGFRIPGKWIWYHSERQQIGRAHV